MYSFFQTNIPRCLLLLWILSKTRILFHWYLVWLVGTGTIPCLAWVLGTVLSHPYRWFCPCLWAVSAHAFTDLNSKEYQEWPSADLQCSFSVRFISFQYSVLKLYPLGLFRPSASSFHLREPTKLHLDSYLPINHLETLEAIIHAIMRITSFIFHPQGSLFFFAWWPGPLNWLLQIYCLVLGVFFLVRGVNLIHFLKVSLPSWQKSLKANFDPVIFHLSKLNLWKLIDLTKGSTASK